MPFRLSCSLRRASSRSGGPCLPPRLSPPPRLPPLPQGSWLFELLPPPGSFHAIAFSVVQNCETASVDTVCRHSHLRNATANTGRFANRNRHPLLQSVLFKEGFRLPALALEQAVEVRPGQAQIQLLATILTGALAEIGRAHVELQSRENLVCRLLLEKKKH